MNGISNLRTNFLRILVGLVTTVAATAASATSAPEIVEYRRVVTPIGKTCEQIVDEIAATIDALGLRVFKKHHESVAENCSFSVKYIREEGQPRFNHAPSKAVFYGFAFRGLEDVYSEAPYRVGLLSKDQCFGQLQDRIAEYEAATGTAILHASCRPANERGWVLTLESASRSDVSLRSMTIHFVGSPVQSQIEEMASVIEREFGVDVTAMASDPYFSYTGHFYFYAPQASEVGTKLTFVSPHIGADSPEDCEKSILDYRTAYESVGVVFAYSTCLRFDHVSGNRPYVANLFLKPQPTFALTTVDNSAVPEFQPWPGYDSHDACRSDLDAAQQFSKEYLRIQAVGGYCEYSYDRKYTMNIVARREPSGVFECTDEAGRAVFRLSTNPDRVTAKVQFAQPIGPFAGEVVAYAEPSTGRDVKYLVKHDDLVLSITHAYAVGFKQLALLRVEGDRSSQIRAFGLTCSESSN